jgi:hypothetical protein
MYYFLTGKILNITPVYNDVNRKANGEYVARSPENIMTHVKQGQIVDQEQIMATDPEEIRLESSKIARRMMSTYPRKRRMTKLKVKRCKCK